MKNGLKWLAGVMGLALIVACLPVVAGDAEKPAAAKPAFGAAGGPGGPGMRAGMGQMLQITQKIRSKERAALEADPKLKAEIEAIDKSRRDKLAAADPELAALYKELDQAQETFKGMHMQRAPKAGEGKKEAPAAGEKKAEKKAETK